MTVEIKVEKDYLWIPVWVKGDKTQITLEVNNKKEMEVNVPVAEDSYIDFYASIPVEHLKGKIVTISGATSKKFYEDIRQESTTYCKEGVDRPAIHFTANTGWINDPNGLVYENGTYHMYFQYNPFHIEWDNMSWGHATSKDLLHWKWEDTVIWPDEDGMMFSGCGLCNDRELLGFPKDALIYFYSAAGNTTSWSKDKMFTQRLAVSIDNGRRLTKIKDVFVPTIEKENRDPKIFWHEQSNAYIMVLWLQEDEFAILRSSDLKDFSISQRLRLKDAFECPDLFELTVEGKEEKKWVFWCADGYYYIGNFDGYTFTCESDKLVSYSSKLPYAAQTISGLSNRVVSIPWLRALFKDRPYTGAMGIPREFSLIETKEGLRLQHNLCKEYLNARKLTNTISLKENIEISRTQKPMEIELTWKGDCRERFEIVIGTEVIYVDYANRKITRNNEESVQLLEHFSGEQLSIIIDDKIVEVTACESTIYIVHELTEQPHADKIKLRVTQKEKECNVNIYEIEMGN